MPRQQTQLPGVVQAQPQARPTDQFVQSKPNYPTPKHVLELSKLSTTLGGLVAQSQMDSHERSMAQGEVDATYGVPFGSSTAQTPEMEANRKAFKSEQQKGTILASEDPWYRIGVYTGEGRRAAISMHQALLNDENVRRASQVYDKNGDFIPFDQREAPAAMFARQSAIFLKAPALQTIYGKQAALKMIESSRAEFIAKVAQARDAQTQQYHETQLADQTVEQLERISLAAPDQSPNGVTLFNESKEGLHDLIAEWTSQWNLPDGPAVARQGFLAYIDKKAVGTPDEPGTPEEALKALDLIRSVKVGPAAVSSDNSKGGLAFRETLHDLESRYTYAAGAEGERQEKNAKLYKESYLRRVEDGISVGFASGMPVSAAYEKIKTRINHEVDPRFRDEALKNLDDQYTDALRPRPNNPQADEELNQRLSSTQTTGQIDEWIREITGEGKDVSYTQGREMRKKLQAEAQAWKDLPAVKTSADSFEKETSAFAADRSEGIQDKLRSLTNDHVLGANQRIQLRASELSDEQRAEKMPGIVAKEYGKATTALNAFKADIQNRAVAFDVELAAANGKGLPYAAKIIEARKAGLLNRSEFNTAIGANSKAADISTYTNDERIKNVVRDLFPTTGDYNDALLGAKWNQINDAQIRASRMAEEWAVNERPKYDSEGAADNAFSKYLNEKIRPEIGKAMKVPGADKPVSSIGTPGGPTFTQTDQAAEGKQFQVVLESGSPEMLRMAAVKSYPAGKNAPKPVVEFQASFGVKNGKIPKIREQARAELAAGLGYGAPDQILTKQSLLRSGAATARELLNGEMDIDGMKVPIAPSDVDIWKTMAFQSSIQIDAAAQDPRTVRTLAARYGVQREDFDMWFKQQKLLLKVNGL